jgi:DNA-binding XRE family transcriptional regulator
MNQDVTEKIQVFEQCIEIVTMLKTQRIRAGFSQDFMADWLNISRKKFNEFENGKFDFELMVMYADKFSIKINISYQ